MAKTCLETITRALRLMGVISAGQIASGSRAADGVERLQDLILNLPGLIQNGRFVEVATSADYEPEEGERVTCTGAVTVTLPTTVLEATTNETRPPMDLARVYVIGTSAAVDFGGDDDGGAGLYVYSASNGAWACVHGLAQDDNLPFGDEDFLGLAAQLAVDWVDDFGAQLGERTFARAQASARGFRARFKKAAPFDASRPSLDYCAPEPDYY